MFDFNLVSFSLVLKLIKDSAKKGWLVAAILIVISAFIGFKYYDLHKANKILRSTRNIYHSQSNIYYIKTLENA